MAVVPMRKDKRRRAKQSSKAARVMAGVSKKQKASKARTKREKRTEAGNAGSAEKSPMPSEESAVQSPISADQARERVVNLVRRAAERLAEGAVKLAIEGQFAQLKYLYELAGIFPATGTTAASTAEEPLIRRIVAKAEESAAGLSTSPLISLGNARLQSG